MSNFVCVPFKSGNKNIGPVVQLCWPPLVDYKQYTIQNTHMSYAVCEVFSVLAIHYTGYVINILSKR